MVIKLRSSCFGQHLKTQLALLLSLSSHMHTCHEASDHHFHREHAAALHDGHIGVGHLQQRILHYVPRLAHPPGAGQVQDLPLHDP